MEARQVAFPAGREGRQLGAHSRKCLGREVSFIFSTGHRRRPRRRRRRLTSGENKNNHAIGL